MMYEFLGLDLDGTIIDDQFNISFEMERFIHKIRDTVNVCIVTGRSVSDAMRYYRKLKLTTPMICYNGGYICNPNNNDTLFSKPISKSEKLLDYLFSEYLINKIDNIIISSGLNTYYINTNNTYLYDMMIDPELPSIRIDTDNFNKQINVHRILVSVKAEYKDFIVNSIKNRNKNIQIFSWRNHDEVIDISIGDVDKWTAITKVCSLLEVNLNKVISIGDGKNDISMINNSSIGLCMKNANEDVRSKVKVITDFDNNNNGAFLSLNKIFNIIIEE